MNHTKPSLVRFSLRTLLVLMMLLCIALATTVSASPRVELVVKLVATLAIPIAAVAAAYCHGRSRAFWLGYLVIGLWLYMLCNVGNYGKYAPQTKIREFLADLMEKPLSELHWRRVEQNTRDHVVASYNKPKLSITQMNNLFPSYWQTKLVDERRKIAYTASKTLFWHLQVLSALVGGAIVSAAYELGRRKMSPNGCASLI